MRRVLLVGLGAGAVGLLACIGSSTPKPTPTPQAHTVHGTMTVPARDSYLELGKPCSGAGGYSDMEAGTQVVVKNGEGNTIATGRLNSGIGKFYVGPACSLSFDIEGVPDSDFYSIEVSHRGAMSYSKGDMESNNWTLALALGNP
ncbi:MAG: hypothetical protein MUP15_04025 [Dehalococcoidia bacterium]|nr:hypothetical protein [Dehalococcoidia bacterium]